MATPVNPCGSGIMYYIKPYFDSETEIISTVNMYKVRRYDEDITKCLDGPGSSHEEPVSEKVRALEQRQEKVLQELHKLQERVQLLAQKQWLNLPVSAPEQPLQKQGMVATSLHKELESPVQTDKLLELVVSADPSSIPLSLLVLLKQLSTQYRVMTNTYVHSSATETPQKLRSFLQNGSQAGARKDYQLALTVIWKKVSRGPRLMVSPVRQTYIEGEANVARYLARLLQPPYDTENITQVTQVDELLDLAQQQLLWGNNKEQSGVLRTLNSLLGKAQWLVGASPSLADVVMWSALHSTHAVDGAAANVKKWLKACGELDAFQEATRFLAL